MSSNLISEVPNKAPKVDRAYFASTRMVVARALCLIFPLVGVVLHCTTLGLNNSSNASELPENAVSCNASDSFSLYSSKFLTNSINIFCGIWLGFSCLAVIYQIIIFLITFMKNVDINYRTLLRFDIGLNSFFFWIFVDGAAGSFLMGFLWSSYRSAAGEQIEGAAATIAVGIIVLQYIAFVMFIICMSQYYSIVMNTSIYFSRYCGTKGCGSRSCEAPIIKDANANKETETAY